MSATDGSRAAADVARSRRDLRASLGTGATVAVVLLGLLTIVEFITAATPAVLALAVGLAVAPVPVYLAIALRIDRFEPEPRGLVIWTFLWGAFVATFIAGVVNTVGEGIVGANLGQGAGEVYGGSISAPVIEEGAKGAVLLLLYRRFRDELDGVVDGVVYAMLVGLGFAMTENIYYYAQGAIEEGVEGALGTFVLRGVISPFAHPLFTAAFGIGLGIAGRTGRRWLRFAAPAVGLCVAIGLHSAWNTAALFEEGFLAVFGLFFVPLFIAAIVFIAAARRREGRILAQWLQPDVAAGRLTASEVEGLASLRARKRAVGRVRARSGRKAAELVRAYHHAASELAFYRHRAARGLLARKGDLRGEEETLVHELGVLRDEVARVLAGPA